MSEIYQSMHLFDLKQDTYVDYSAYTPLPKKRIAMPDAKRRLYRFMERQTADEDKEVVRQFVDLSTITERIRSKKIISLDYMTTENRWYRASFVVIKRRFSGELRTLLLTIRDIDSEKRKEESLLYASHTDELTQLRNRRAYLEDVQLMLAMHMPFVYIAMDANGLKQVSSTIGLEAGDEFAAVLMVDKKCLKYIQRDFEETMNKWTGRLASHIHVACGYVYSQDIDWTSMNDIERVGDQRMYADKEAYYKRIENNRKKY